MRYTGHLTPQARADLNAAYEFIWERSPQGADDWLDAVEAAIASLGEFPERCPAARESETHARPLRQLIVAGYRVVFAMEGDSVRVLQVRHAARRDAGPGELMP